MIKVGINGFGRIGRVALRAVLTKYLDKVKVVAINTSGSMEIEGWAQLFEYDSVYGRFKGNVQIEKSKNGEIGVLVINHQRIPVLAEREPAKIPWKKYEAEVVIEATGVFRDRQSVASHFQGGAKKIVVSAPVEGIKTFIIGVNEKDYHGDLIVDNASCTTNCVAPVTKVMMESFGVQKALLSTIHAYTADQELVDGSHKDLRRARSAAVNIIPTSTGADETTVEVIPVLKGLFDGLAYRVPVICGSVVDFCFVTSKRTTVAEVNKAFMKAAKEKYKGIVEVSDKPLVSTDIIGDSASAIVDLSLTQVIDGDLVKVVAWYDNEWAYSCRLIEEVIWISQH
ncbi:type I glyceraldehyde-3-phosphate dehydrogenase [Patescibacteria group bacterium]|nr:type I glyceraldehyde-3-phosphate dehydrogenase [Patescibacteria group bacterium]